MLRVWLYFLIQENVPQSLSFWPDPIKAKTVESAQASLWLIPEWLLSQPGVEGVRWISPQDLSAEHQDPLTSSDGGHLMFSNDSGCWWGLV